MDKSILIKKGELLRNVALWSIIAFLALLSLFPLYYLILTSLKTRHLLFTEPPPFFFLPSLHHYYSLFIKENYWYYYLNSLIVSVPATAISLMLGCMGAFAFARFRFWLSGVLFFLVLVTRSYMPVTTVIPLFLAAKEFSLLDTRILLIVVYAGFQLPLVVLVMRSFFAEIPTEVFECAELDGCTFLGLYFRIGLPLATSGLMAVAILVFIFTWNEFLFALVTTSVNAVTAPVAITAFKEMETDVNWGQLATLGLATALPIVMFMVFSKKFLVRGLLVGAIKG